MERTRGKGYFSLIKVKEAETTRLENDLSSTEAVALPEHFAPKRPMGRTTGPMMYQGVRSQLETKARKDVSEAQFMGRSRTSSLFKDSSEPFNTGPATVVRNRLLRSLETHWDHNEWHLCLAPLNIGRNRILGRKTPIRALEDRCGSQ